MVLQIYDVISECDDGKPRERDLSAITTLAIHRVGIDKLQNLVLGLDAVAICQRFISDPEVAKYTGAEVPYTFIIGGEHGDYDGLIWQCLPISDVGAHARRWSTPAVGIACVGDFRVDPPSEAQRDSLVALCSVLEDCFGDLEIRGHDELKGGSSDPNKKCPGDKLHMGALRRDIKHHELVELVGARLVKEGIQV